MVLSTLAMLAIQSSNATVQGPVTAILYVGSEAPSDEIRSRLRSSDLEKLPGSLPKDRFMCLRRGECWVIVDRIDPELNSHVRLARALGDIQTAALKSVHGTIDLESLGSAASSAFIDSMPWGLTPEGNPSIAVVPTLFIAGSHGDKTATAGYEPQASPPAGVFMVDPRGKQPGTTKPLTSLNNRAYTRTVELVRGPRSAAVKESGAALEAFDQEFQALKQKSDEKFVDLFESLCKKLGHQDIEESLQKAKRFSDLPKSIQAEMKGFIRSRWKSQGFASLEDAMQSLNGDASLMLGIKFTLNIQQENGQISSAVYQLLANPKKAPPP